MPHAAVALNTLLWKRAANAMSASALENLVRVQRTTEAGERIAYLDGWRGLAVLFVLLDHFSHGLFGWAGDLGVELFFVLSGSLMAQIIFVRKVAVRTFIVRRLSRVYPALFVFATAMTVVSTIAIRFGLPPQMAVSPSEYGYALIFLSNYYHVITGTNSVVGHLWSLSVEEHSYIILLMIAFFVGWRANRGAIVMTILALMALLNGMRLESAGLEAHAIYWRSDVRIASILISCVIFLVLRTKKVPTLIAPALLVVGIALFALSPDPVRFTLGSLCLAISVNSLADAPNGFRALLSMPIFTRVGLYSYSLYLWQQPFYKVAERAPLWLTPVALATTFVVAYLSFRIVENPTRDAINRRFGQLSHH